ncbi:MAG: hypothetical protein ACREI8_10375, partial [Myxococcota bacterium]
RRSLEAHQAVVKRRAATETARLRGAMGWHSSAGSPGPRFARKRAPSAQRPAPATPVPKRRARKSTAVKQERPEEGAVAPAQAPDPLPELRAHVAEPILHPPEPEAAVSPDPVKQCAALCAEGRFDEAARLARHRLAGHADPGPLLVELSRAQFGLGLVDAAIDTAQDAHFASRSRESVAHLLRLLSVTRRFAAADGDSLRRAASRHPRQPLALHAAGVFESMYGDLCSAAKLLRTALELEPGEDVRRAIQSELSCVEERLALPAPRG